ncbi:MAG: sel1 repeat family protein [Shewanellaceae bacterium]|nr:sel1 repeat family protein [Shewanellaceae bacterium]
MNKMVLGLLAWSSAWMVQAQTLEGTLLVNNQAAAQQHYNEAQVKLINRKQRSDNVKDAILLLHKAAELGHADAQVKLGKLYSTGIDAPVNIPSAVFWLTKAAASDHPEGLYQLAVFYHKGIGVPKSQAKAIDLWERGAKLSHGHSQLQLALAYSFGDGTNRNYAHAYAWAYVAAKNGTNHADELKNVIGSQILSKKDLVQAQQLAEEWGKLYY